MYSKSYTKQKGDKTMGILNLLKGNYTGRVGQTVGAKWKDKSTVRTYSVPSNPRTDAQMSVRGGFSSITKFTALFADQIKYLSALNTAGMSVRNAIIKLNKGMVSANSFDKANFLISNGGLQIPANFAASEVSGKIKITWDEPTATNFSTNAKLVVVAVQEASGIVEVIESSYNAATQTGLATFQTGDVDVYAYYIDKRGSNKVGSKSVYKNVTIA